MTAYPELAARRDQARTTAEEASRLDAQLRAAQAELARLQDEQPRNRRAIVATQRRVGQLTERLGTASQAAAAARRAYETALDALPASLDPALPVLLLPVRLETRIRSRTDGATGDELVVRVYPDDVHLDAHDPRLTEDEVQLGGHYWRQRWAVEAAAAVDAEQQAQAAWRQLTTRLGTARGAWVARALTPANLPPTTGAEPDLPDPPVRPPGEERAMLAAALPDRWVVRAWRDGALMGEARGELISRPLVVGPPTGEPGGPQGWLTELGPALDAGMAVIVRPGTPAVIDRVDTVTAFGVRASDSPAEAAALLRDLLDAHHFALRPGSAGLDLVPQGTPTNNTPTARAPARTDPSSTRSGDAWTGPPAATRGDGSDADLLAAALGLPDRDPRWTGDADRFPLGRLEHAASTDQRNAAAMAAVLWPASWGYFLRQFLSGVEGIEPDADLGEWRQFILDTVRGRGPLPTLRVADQPYGVLPVLPADRWRPWPDQPELFAFTLTLAGGAADAWLLVSWDLDARGAWTGGWTGPERVPVDTASNGLAAAAADLDGDGRPELVVLTTRRAGDAALQVGLQLDERGIPRLWTTPQPLPAPTGGMRVLGGGAGVAVTTLDGQLALVAVTDERSIMSRPPVTVVRVATGIAPDGNGANWSNPVEVPGRGSDLRLTGAAAGSGAGSGGIDLVLAFVRATAGGEELVYRVGSGLDAGGAVQRWSGLQAVPVDLADGRPLAGGGIALADLDGDGRATDLVLHAVTDANGQPAATYAVGLGLDAAGTVTGGWQGPYATGSPLAGGGQVAAAGVAVAAVGCSALVTTASATGLVNLAERARDAWRAGSAAVPRVGRAADPTDDLLDLLATDAVSGHVRVRGLFGMQLLGNMWIAAGRALNLGAYGQDLWQASRMLLEDWGLLDPAAPGADDPTGKPRLGRAAFEPVAVTFPEAFAGDGTSAPDSATSLAFAAKATPDELHAWSLPPDAPLLDWLVRHATLQAWADAALALRPPDGGRTDQPPWTEPELVDLAELRDPDPFEQPQTPTSWRHLERARMPQNDPRWPSQPAVKKVVAELLQRAEAGDQLAAFGTGGRRVVELAELRAALTWLAGRSAGALARVLGETMDLASHRLDAWLTALATQRLRALRRAEPTGIQLGGFGAVTGLRARRGPPSEGYVHAPSVGHAATAAVLRSGYLTHAGTPLGQRLALDLTSRRVRLALELATGVRAGHQLGALLGYRLERALHDRPALALARYLPALRQIAPLAADKRAPVPTGTSVDAVAAPVVVDGLALLRIATKIPWGQQPGGSDVALPATGSTDQARLLELLAELRDTVDALGDLSVAEAVHQAVHGNASAAGGALDVLAGGEVPPVDPEVVRTPAAGVGVTHRLLVALPDPAEQRVAAAVAKWTGGGAQPRARAMPRLDAWAATLLPDPEQVRWQASWHEPGGDQLAAQTYTLAAVGLCALDLVQLAAKPVRSDAPGGPDDARNDLERLLALHAATRAPAGGAGGGVRLNLERDADWPTGHLTVGELVEVARAARELLAHARPAAAGDLAGPSGTRPDAGHRTGALAGPATAAASALDAATTALRAPFELDDPDAGRAAIAGAYPQLPAETFGTLDNLLDLPAHLDLAPAVAATALPGPADAGAVRDALRRLASFGLDGAAPASPADSAGAELAALTTQARQVAAAAAARAAAAQDAADPAEQLVALFGPAFTVVPELIVPDAGGLADGLTARAADAPDPAVADWLEGAAHVRAGAALLADLRLLAEATGSAGAHLTVAQLPARPGDWWAALPTPPNQRLGAGVVALAFAGLPFDLADPFAGLLLDEWVEVLPAAKQDTAVVFHADAPGARAPQALLLACAADPSRRWDDDELEHVVLDTLELARLRAVDAGLGGGAPPAGHWLPALLLARNTGGDPNGDTVAATLPLAPPPKPPGP